MRGETLTFEDVPKYVFQDAGQLIEDYSAAIF
jgi:hypothetical protein